MNPENPTIIDLTAEPDSPVQVNRPVPIPNEPRLESRGHSNGNRSHHPLHSSIGWQHRILVAGDAVIDLTDDADEVEIVAHNGHGPGPSRTANGAGAGSGFEPVSGNRPSELFGMRYFTGLGGLNPLNFNSMPSISEFFQVRRVRSPDHHQHRHHDPYANNDANDGNNGGGIRNRRDEFSEGARLRAAAENAHGFRAGPAARHISGPGINIDLDAHFVGHMIGDQHQLQHHLQLQHQHQHQHPHQHQHQHHHRQHQHQHQHHHHHQQQQHYHQRHHRLQNPLGGNIPDLNYQMNGLLQQVMGQGGVGNALFDAVGANPDKPPYTAPPAVAEGYTRDTTAAAENEDGDGDDMFVCASCERELVYDPDGDNQQNGDGGSPLAKRARNRRDREEHYFWAVAECGHVYCKWCFDNRREAIKGSERDDGLFLRFRSSGKVVRCAVENCDTDVTAKKAWVGLFV